VLLSQEEEGNSGFDQYSSSVFNSKKNALYVISGMTENQGGVVLPVPIFSLVLIDQIGQNNSVNTNLKAKYIDVAVTQRGDNNQFIVDKQANVIIQNVYQNGQNNTIRDFSLKMNEEVNVQYIQQGDNQNIQVMGSNSLSRSMRVIQSGNGASVIILNQ